MASYIGIIHKDEGSEFGVSFPDFPGCISAGETPDEAGRSAGEALALHVAGMVEDGESIPTPMSIEQAQAHEFAQGAVAFLVVRAQIPEPDKTVRVNITLRESELRRIDEEAARIGRTRSSYLVQRALGL